MTAAELIAAEREAGEGFQGPVNEYVLLEAPAAFRIRNVFVPESYLSRA